MYFVIHPPRLKLVLLHHYNGKKLLTETISTVLALQEPWPEKRTLVLHLCDNLLLPGLQLFKI